MNNILKHVIKRILIKDYPLESSFPLVVNNDHIGKQVLIDGFYERFFLENIVKNLNEKVFLDTMVDVGANIGNHTVFFSKYFKKIIAFEPQKRTFQILKINCQNISNIETFNYGLSLKNKTLNFQIHKMNFGNGKELKGKLNKNYFVEEVKLKKHQFAKKDKISIVKIDVEGSECDVLLSMEDQIILNKPIILFEFNDYKTKNSIISLLNKFEYTDFYVFKKELVRNPLKKLFPKDLSRLKKIKLDSKKDFSMVITYRRDSEYKLNNIN